MDEFSGRYYILKQVNGTVQIQWLSGVADGGVPVWIDDTQPRASLDRLQFHMMEAGIIVSLLHRLGEPYAFACPVENCN